MISDTEPHQKTDSARGRSDLEDYKTETSSSPSSRRARSPLYGKMPSGNMAARLWLCALSYASVHHPYIIPIAPEVVECQVRGLCSSARHTPVSSRRPPTFRTMDHAGRPPSWRAGGPFAILNIPRLPALLSVLQESLRSRCCKQPWLHALSHGYSGCRIRVYIACFIFPARGVAEPSVVPLAVARFDHTRHHRVLKR